MNKDRRPKRQKYNPTKPSQAAFTTTNIIKDLKVSMAPLEYTARVFVQIKMLYEAYYNTDQDASVFGEEFYFAVGEILKGKSIKDLDLKYLKKE